jgi:hypothetical protein
VSNTFTEQELDEIQFLFDEVNRIAGFANFIA